MPIPNLPIFKLCSLRIVPFITLKIEGNIPCNPESGSREQRDPARGKNKMH